MEEIYMNRRKSFLCGATSLAIMAAVLIAHAAINTQGLVGRWIFNEASGITANDSSGFGDNGMLSGATLFTSDLQRGQVLSITGISGMAGIPYSHNLEPYQGTISVWVKPALASWGVVLQHQTDKLLRCTTQYGGAAYDIRLSNTGGVIADFANDDPKTCSRSPQTMLTSPANSAPLNQWTHIVSRWDGAGTLSLFVNGKQVAKSSYIPNPTYGLSYHGTTPVVVGTLPGGSQSYYGLVSDLRIYSRALSNTEISNIYLNQQ
jgi:opacity protein-like surface antigen